MWFINILKKNNVYNYNPSPTPKDTAENMAEEIATSIPASTFRAIMEIITSQRLRVPHKVSVARFAAMIRSMIKNGEPMRDWED